MSEEQWTKSSFSGGIGACVEVRRVGGEIAVRNSRSPSAEQTYTQAEIRAFIDGVKAGEFDYLLD
ncbi:DUF397 domain-containing protein [Pseudonocardia broussonetiae]|uniref:DUF397 domain-containing protein n=1 Tax=Pseudonocardia broussonetiae TaxID=2736640 RepID=A0A6M6JE22_9PSEU|nr:DUF397 domain-containing protein [Pseudonocardia broussonetiae]QJY46184.1 DUF397 domain-containing protein [Pseudonocardia broussonetiae]